MTIIFTQREMQKAWRNHFFAYKTATSMNRFLTWLDVRRRILQETRRDRELKNKGIVRVNCFSDAVEIGITGDKESAKSIVKYA